MSSNSGDLPDCGDAASFPPASDEKSASGTLVTFIETTSAAPTGRRADEDKQEPARSAGDGLFCLNAPGGRSDAQPKETQNSADAIKSRRDFEAFLRASGFSRAAAKSLAAGGWSAVGDSDNDDVSELEDILRAQLKEMTQWTSRK